MTRGLAWSGRRRRAAAAAAPVGHGTFCARPGRGGRRPAAGDLPPRWRPPWGTRERSSLLPQHLSGLSDTRGSAREASSTPRPEAVPLKRREAERMCSAAIAQAQAQAAHDAHGAGRTLRRRGSLVSHLCFQGCFCSHQVILKPVSISINTIQGPLLTNNLGCRQFFFKEGSFLRTEHRLLYIYRVPVISPIQLPLVFSTSWAWYPMSKHLKSSLNSCTHDLVPETEHG